MVRVELRGINTKEKFVEKVKAAATSKYFSHTNYVTLMPRPGP